MDLYRTLEKFKILKFAKKLTFMMIVHATMNHLIVIATEQIKYI